MNENTKKCNDGLDILKKNKTKEYIYFFFIYFIFFIYLYFGAIILKNFYKNMLSHLIASFILYIPVFIYIYFSAKIRNITAKDMGVTKDCLGIVIILMLFYIGLFMIRGEYTLDKTMKWVFFFVCTGITEELIFRGYVYERSKQFMTRRQSFLWNCLLFTIIHVSPQIVLRGLTIEEVILYVPNNIVVMSLITLTFIIIKEKTNTIWIPVILHSIINFIFSWRN